MDVEKDNKAKCNKNGEKDDGLFDHFDDFLINFLNTFFPATYPFPATSFPIVEEVRWCG